MTVISYKNRPAGKEFNNSLHDFFPALPSSQKNEESQKVPVNITETDNSYIIEFLAAGFNKEDFKISIDKDQLTIESVMMNSDVKENHKIIKREYKIKPFKRSFTLDKTIDADNIIASYQNGVLSITLPKKVEVKEPLRTISVL